MIEKTGRDNFTNIINHIRLLGIISFVLMLILAILHMKLSSRLNALEKDNIEARRDQFIIQIVESALLNDNDFLEKVAGVKNHFEWIDEISNEYHVLKDTHFEYTKHFICFGNNNTLLIQTGRLKTSYYGGSVFEIDVIQFEREQACRFQRPNPTQFYMIGDHRFYAN